MKETNKETGRNATDAGHFGTRGTQNRVRGRQHDSLPQSSDVAG